MFFLTSPTNWTLLEKALMAAISGVASHLCFYNYGEHHMEAPLLFRLYVILFSVLLYGEIAVKNQDTTRGTTEVLWVSAAYTLSLLTSIVIYRKAFHQLRKFPGPFMASVTKLWHTANTLDSQNHILLDGLHQKYGDFVRTGKGSEQSSENIFSLTHRKMFKGPDEITIFTPEVKWAVDGPINRCNKAVWYDILLPLIALNTTRSKKEHDQRRRTWDRAFTVKGWPLPSIEEAHPLTHHLIALEGYEKRIQSYGLLLEKHIASTSGKPIDVSTWFYFLSFDVMGDFAFAKSFKMLESKEWHYAVLMLRRALNLLGPLSSVPWLVQLAFSFPVIPVVRDWNKMIGWCAERMGERIQVSNKPSSFLHASTFSIS